MCWLILLVDDWNSQVTSHSRTSSRANASARGNGPVTERWKWDDTTEDEVYEHLEEELRDAKTRLHARVERVEARKRRIRCAEEKVIAPRSLILLHTYIYQPLVLSCLLTDVMKLSYIDTAHLYLSISVSLCPSVHEYSCHF